jgi:DNA (cytosine-5)-methyltransferase 1
VSRPVLLDLFCGEGGAGVGYHRAGFDVVGVDLDPQPRYPFEFVRADALKVDLDGFDVIHASPPCQAHSDLQKQSKRSYVDLIGPVRDRLRATGLPYVIENVEGAPLIDPVNICGASIPGLRVIRHRLFESNVPIVGVPCPDRHPLVFTHDRRKAHHGKLDQNTSFVQVTGGGNCTIINKRAAMGTPWMTAHGCNEAIPPAYAEHIGLQLLEAIGVPPRHSQP